MTVCRNRIGVKMLLLKLKTAKQRFMIGQNKYFIIFVPINVVFLNIENTPKTEFLLYIT